MSDDTSCASNIELVAEEANDSEMPVVDCDDKEDQRSGQACETFLVKTPCDHAMRIADYKDDAKKDELLFYPGFDNYDHFMFVFDLLGPAVYDLQYHSFSAQSRLMTKCLRPEDQFFLTMVKLRRFKINKELGYTFRITEHHVSCYLITWINFLYCQLSEIVTWPNPKDLHSVMKMKDSELDATCIID